MILWSFVIFFKKYLALQKKNNWEALTIGKHGLQQSLLDIIFHLVYIGLMRTQVY